MFLANYEQLYGNFYYLNSSAVMQTDSILYQLKKMNLNQYLQQNETK
jgi:hypothetical protein